MPIVILIGCDQYWAFIEGSIIQGDLPGQVAALTKVGYVFSGPMHCQGNNQFSINFVSTHVLKTDAQPIEDDINLKNELIQFCELEHKGIQKQEHSVHDKFVQDIKFVDDRPVRYHCLSRTRMT